MRKKILTVGLILIMLLSSTCFAAEIVFTDIDNHWAKNEVYEMANKWVILGYPDLTFKPDESIMKTHAFLMFARLNGYFETENEGMIEIALEKYGELLTNANILDANAEISFLIEKGVITLEDVISLLGNGQEKSYLTREEAAYIFVKLLGDEKNLNSFPLVTFEDANLVTEKYVGYVEYVNKINLMIGSDNKFDPQGYVTRAQIATILSRVDRILYERTSDNVSGLVTEVDLLNSIIKINVNNEKQTYVLSRSLQVYDNTTKVSKTLLSENDSVTAYMEDGIIGRIVVSNVTKNIYVKFDSYKTVDEKNIIKVTQDGKTFEYSLINNVVIKKDNNNLLLKDIIENEDIELIIVNNNVEKIIVGVFNYSKQGNIVEIIIGTTSYISIKDVYEKIYKYEIAQNANYDFDGANGSIYDLRLGMDVKLVVTHNGVTLVKVETLTNIEVISGTIQQVVPNLYVFFVKTSTEDIQMIFLDEEETIIIRENGEPQTIEDVNINDVVSVYGRYENEVFYPLQVIIY